MPCMRELVDRQVSAEQSLATTAGLCVLEVLRLEATEPESAPTVGLVGKLRKLSIVR